MFAIRSTFIQLGLAAALLAGTPALADPGIMQRDTAKGPVLTDAAGMTLYTFDKDENGQPSCYGGCAQNWPPLIAPAGAEEDDDYGLAQRTDGTMQWTYYGKPLYHWKKDSVPGDVTGDGVGGAWHVARPE